MNVVSNTSPLIALSCIRKLNILNELFNEIFIPKAVLSETEHLIDNINKLSFIKVVKVKDINLVQTLNLRLDYGESEVIAYALESKNNFVLLDDKDARKMAKNLNLKIMGTVGILLLAKRQGLIKNIRSEIVKLESEINFRLSETIKNNIYKEAGE